MVELVNDGRCDKFFYLRKINNKPRSGYIPLAGIPGGNCYMQFIGMAMDVFTGAGITVDGMGSFELENFSKLYHEW